MVRIGGRRLAALAATIGFFATAAAQTMPSQTRPTGDEIQGAWRPTKILYPSGTVDPQGGFVFFGGYYSATVNYSREGTQTNISQFGTYVLEGRRLALVPQVHVSTRGDTIFYQPEPPFTLEVTLFGDEMRGVSADGTTFLFKRLR
jgi:hypothetical protein